MNNLGQIYEKKKFSYCVKLSFLLFGNLSLQAPFKHSITPTSLDLEQIHKDLAETREAIENIDPADIPNGGKKESVVPPQPTVDLCKSIVTFVKNNHYNVHEERSVLENDSLNQTTTEGSWLPDTTRDKSRENCSNDTTKDTNPENASEDGNTQTKNFMLFPIDTNPSESKNAADTISTFSNSGSSCNSDSPEEESEDSNSDAPSSISDADDDNDKRSTRTTETSPGNDSNYEIDLSPLENSICTMLKEKHNFSILSSSTRQDENKTHVSITYDANKKNYNCFGGLFFGNDVIENKLHICTEINDGNCETIVIVWKGNEDQRYGAIFLGFLPEPYDEAWTAENKDFRRMWRGTKDRPVDTTEFKAWMLEALEGTATKVPVLKRKTQTLWILTQTVTC